MDQKKQISILVRDTRASLGLTQEKFGGLIGRARYVVADYETGRSTPPGDVLLKIQDLAERARTGQSKVA